MLDTHYYCYAFGVGMHHKDVALCIVRVNSLAPFYIRPHIDASEPGSCNRRSPSFSLYTTELSGNTMSPTILSSATVFLGLALSIEAAKISKDARNSKTPAPSTDSGKYVKQDIFLEDVLIILYRVLLARIAVQAPGL